MHACIPTYLHTSVRARVRKKVEEDGEGERERGREGERERGREGERARARERMEMDG